jgi:hypothetical protein
MPIIRKIKIKISNIKFFRYYFLSSKNHLLVSVLTTPIIFWPMADRTPVFHLDTLNLNFSDYQKSFLLAPKPETLLGTQWCDNLNKCAHLIGLLGLKYYEKS